MIATIEMPTTITAAKASSSLAVRLRWSGAMRRIEGVSHSEDCAHILGPAWVGLKLVPQVLHMAVDRPFEAFKGRSLHGVEQLLAVKDTSRLRGEGGEDRELSGRQGKDLTISPHLMPFQ